MDGIKNLLFGIALILLGLYGVMGGYFLLLTFLCGPLGALYCIYGLLKKEKK